VTDESAVEPSERRRSAGEPPDQPSGAETSGPELARAVLDAARRRSGGGRKRADAAGDAGTVTSAGDGSARSRTGGTGRARRLRGYSGPGPDPRDPQPFGAILDRLMQVRGWQRPAAEARVFGAWSKVVGEDVAAHCRPVKLEGGELVIEAESTAWATQLRLLASSLLVRIAGEVGHGVVRRLNIHGPVAPTWARGQRRVRGRGPRDTYG